jgi:hypothetical protein
MKKYKIYKLGYLEGIYIKNGPARMIMENLFGNLWEEYKLVFIAISEQVVPSISSCILHNVIGPAAIKFDGTCEWWIEGNRVTEKEFQSYTRNKAFW